MGFKRVQVQIQIGEVNVNPRLINPRLFIWGVPFLQPIISLLGITTTIHKPGFANPGLTLVIFSDPSCGDHTLGDCAELGTHPVPSHGYKAGGLPMPTGAW